MNEQRAFTVVVTGCKDCPKTKYSMFTGNYWCGHDPNGVSASVHIYDQNYSAITPTCPMWNEAKPIGELK
jgi:hypothetical protein